MRHVLITDELAQDFRIPAFRLPSVAHFGVRYTWPSALAIEARQGQDRATVLGGNRESAGRQATPKIHPGT